jgi:hypothetical protein
MPEPVFSPPGRDFSQLLGAMNELLAVLSTDGGEEAALRASFEAAARGFGANKALLLVVERPEPLRLRAVHVLGNLTRELRFGCTATCGSWRAPRRPSSPGSADVPRCSLQEVKSIRDMRKM